MIWTNIAARFAPLMASFRGSRLTAQTQTTRNDYPELNLCGNIDLKDLELDTNAYKYEAARCVCLGRIPTLLAKPDPYLNSAIVTFGVEGTYRLLEAMKSMANAFAHQVLGSVVNSAALWNSIIWSKPHRNGFLESPNTATRGAKPEKKFVAFREPKMDGSV
ncbi:hypothetical protein FRC07_008939 [Ceratobasidium sp. 392]|nr:hypothetical protein FRC07_008939 [Ceratobasidium sp. 392]